MGATRKGLDKVMCKLRIGKYDMNEFQPLAELSGKVLILEPFAIE